MGGNNHTDTHMEIAKTIKGKYVAVNLISKLDTLLSHFFFFRKKRLATSFHSHPWDMTWHDMIKSKQRFKQKKVFVRYVVPLVSLWDGLKIMAVAIMNVGM